MFGHQDDQVTTDSLTDNSSTAQPYNDNSFMVGDNPNPTDGHDAPAEPVTEQPSDLPVPAPDSSTPTEEPQTTDDNSGTTNISHDLVIPASDDTSAPSDEPVQNTVDPGTDPSTDGLLDVKKKALTELTPLVSHLDQPPEEQFRTMMMMIQASDNQFLIESAYEAAHNIADEKARAQALLDVVNEINYFTQNPSTE